MNWIATIFTRFYIKPDTQPLLESLRKQNEQFQPTEHTKVIMNESDELLNKKDVPKNGQLTWAGDGERMKSSRYDWISRLELVRRKSQLSFIARLWQISLNKILISDTQLSFVRKPRLLPPTNFLSLDPEGDSNESDDEDFEAASAKALAMGVLKRISKMFDDTSWSDRCILFLGIISAFVHAASFPISAMLFGKIMHVYILQKSGEMENIPHSPHNISNASIGVTGQLALSFLTKVTAKVDPNLNSSVNLTVDRGSGYFGRSGFFNTNGTETIDDLATMVADVSLYFIYIGIAVFFASFLQTLSWEWVAEIQLYKIKQKYIYQLLRQEMPFFRRRAAGTLVLKIADDCERVREGIGQKFVLVIEYSAIAFYGAGIALLTNAKLTLVFLASAPFILTKLIVIWQKMAQKSALSQKEYAKAGKMCSEVLTGIKTVAALAREKMEVARYEAALLKGCRPAECREFLSGAGIGGMYFLLFIFYAAVLWYSVNLLAEDVVTTTDIYTVFFGLAICSFAVGSALPYANSIALSYASFKLLTPVLDSVPDIDPYSSKGQKPRNFSGTIKFSNITFAYPGKEASPIFKDLELEIPSCGVTAVVGGNNSGKASLTKLMLRFYDPQMGLVSFDNNPLKTLNVRWIREQISIIDPHVVLYDDTIFENIRTSNTHITMDRVIEAAKLARAHGFIMGLPDGYNTRLKLSGGRDLSICQRIRIYIAKFIIRNPKVLILDKAISALDPHDAQNVIKKLAEFRKDSTTIILDNKFEVAQNANLIVVLKKGRTIEQGDHKTLYEQRGEYFNMLQVEKFVDDIPKGVGTAGQPKKFRKLKRLIANIGEAHTILKYKKKLLYLKEKAQTRLETAEADILKQIPPIAKVFGIMPGARKLLYLGIFGCILSGFLVPLFAICLGQTLNMFLGAKEDLFASGMFWVQMLIALAFLAAIGYSTRTIVFGMVGEELSMNLRVAAYKSILRQPVSWFDFEQNAPGFLYARLAAGIPIIRNALGTSLCTAMNAFATTLVVLGFTTMYIWQMALIASCIIPISTCGFFILRKVFRESEVELVGYQRKFIKFTNSISMHIPEIQAGCLQYAICKRVEEWIYPALVIGQKRAVVYAIVYASGECLMLFSFGAAFRFGAELLRDGSVSILNLFSVFCLLAFGSLSFGQAISYIPEYFKARISSAHIFRLIDMKSSADPYDDGGAKPPIKGQIEFRDVVFSYPLAPDIKVLDGVSFTISANFSIGIVGLAGSGKSSIMQILERFYEIDSGEVLIDGVNIKEINLKHLRSHIGYVQEQPVLFDMTIKENIVAGYHGDFTGEKLQQLVITAANAADADFITNELPHQFATRCGEHGKHLDTGQRQGVALARSVINEPAILLFDGPTRLLDPDEEKRVQAGMSELIKDKTILITDSYSSIKFCEYVAVLAKGRVVEFGKQEELLQNKGIYYNLLKRQGAGKHQEVDT